MEDTLLYFSAETGNLRESSRSEVADHIVGAVRKALDEVLAGKGYTRIESTNWTLKAAEDGALTVRLWPQSMKLSGPPGVAARVERGGLGRVSRLTVSMAGLVDAVAALDASDLARAAAWAWLDRGSP